ncbi:MAG: hypothetical protein JKX69_07685 [Rhodobacteraceae bacterium]|nr:hypothetical protein [Paracoccaceae bacterium]
MSEFLPEAVRQGLAEAREAMLRKSSRLCVHDGDDVHRVRRLWQGGFAMAKDAPPLRGLVDIYDGARHLYHCLVVTSREEGGERVYEFKWNTPYADRPALDFVAEQEAPVAYLPR